MPYQPILATLGYVFSPDGRSMLMVHRIARPDDPHYGKFNGLGGKLERDEDIVTGMKREIREEAGLDCTELSLCGTVSWPGFGKQGEDWFGFVFRITQWQGEPHPASPEGPLVWVPRDQVLSLHLWEGDRYFLPAVLNEQARPFHGVMPYQDGRPLRWSVSELGR